MSHVSFADFGKAVETKVEQVITKVENLVDSAITEVIGEVYPPESTEEAVADLMDQHEEGAEPPVEEVK